MKSAIRMSAIMLTLFAAIFMTSCGSGASGDAGKLADAIDQITSAADSNDEAKAMAAVETIGSLTDSQEQLTDSGIDAIANASYKMAAKFAEMAGVTIPSEAKSQMIDAMKQEYKGQTVGSIATDMYNGIASQLGL